MDFERFFCVVHARDDGGRRLAVDSLYRRISNNSDTLVIRTPPFSSKRC